MAFLYIIVIIVETIILISFKKRACHGTKGTIRHAFANKTSWHLHIVDCCICCCYFKSRFSGPKYSVGNISLNCSPPGQDQDPHFPGLKCSRRPPHVWGICQCSEIISLQILWLIVISHTTKCFKGKALLYDLRNVPGERIWISAGWETFKS